MAQKQIVTLLVVPTNITFKIACLHKKANIQEKSKSWSTDVDVPVVSWSPWSHSQLFNPLARKARSLLLWWHLPYLDIKGKKTLMQGKKCNIDSSCKWWYSDGDPSSDSRQACHIKTILNQQNTFSLYQDILLDTIRYLIWLTYFQGQKNQAQPDSNWLLISKIKTRFQLGNP